MNTERPHSSWCFRIGTIVYWLIIALVMYLCCPVPQGGHTGHGKGPGAGQGPGTSYTAPNAGAGSTAAAPAPKSAKTIVINSARSAAAEKKSAAPVIPAPARLPAAPVPAAPRKAVPAPRTVAEFGAASQTAPAEVPPSGGGAKKGFFGVEVVNEGNVLFLLDVSGSMASTTQDSSSRIELLKKEFLKVLNERQHKASDKDSDGRSMLNSSGSSQYFRIITFSSGVSYFPDAKAKALRFSRKEDIAKAEHFVLGLTANGETAMKKAWSEPATCQLLKKGFFQTAYFLSDGAPTDCSQQDLLALLKQNFPRLKIHTFSMGARSGLMEAVAKQHRGKYVEIY